LFAVTTATAWLGLVTVTTVSWPVVAVGGALAGTGIMTGAINTARLRERFAERLKVKVRAHLLASLIAGTAKRPAVLQQLTRALATAADETQAMR
ncbi:hypothetical protein WB334_25165, partial [Escherichia coli]|uniref:hypothetical protein n=1 Tax=Escherichia coli TaxID=562 RepID=UPI0021587BD1